MVIDPDQESPLLEWLKETVAVEIHTEERSFGGERYPVTVWISNGDTDPRTWAGTMIARCKNDADAVLVAVALARLQRES
jgi:hypothetical protein